MQIQISRTETKNKMRNKKIIGCTLLLSGLGLTGLYAQETVPASGGNATGSNGTVSYSVGQVAYTTNAGTNGSVAQGVQQPYEISVMTSIEQANIISLAFIAYPNPTVENVKLNIGNYKTDNLIYQLFDVSGKLIQNTKIESTETIIKMENLDHAAYFLKVIDNNKEVKVFKIIKN